MCITLAVKQTTHLVLGIGTVLFQERIICSYRKIRRRKISMWSQAIKHYERERRKDVTAAGATPVQMLMQRVLAAPLLSFSFLKLFRLTTSESPPWVPHYLQEYNFQQGNSLQYCMVKHCSSLLEGQANI